MYNYPDNETFIKQVVIPYFTGAVNKKFFSAVFDLDGRMIITTDLYAKFLGYSSWEQVQGKTIKEAYQGNEYDSLINDLNNIRKSVIQQKKIITHVNLLPMPWGIIVAYHFPVFNPKGEVVATRIVSKRLNVFKASLQINQQLKKMALRNKDVDLRKSKLTKRQREILFLLTMGFSQEQAAEYLGIKRGTLAKVVSEQICPIFGISGSNTKLLIQTVIANDYFIGFPEGLIAHKIIEVENTFELKQLYQSHLA